MPRKGRKTKEDEKGDAFERLYAFLMASNQNLPSLEKSHLDVVEKKKAPPTQEEIEREREREKAEFDKLYTQLSSLSARRSIETAPVLSVPAPVLSVPAPVLSVPAPSVPAPSVPALSEPIMPIPNTNKIEPLPTKTISIPNTPLTKVLTEPSLENISNEFDEVYEQIIRIIAMKSQMQTTTPIIKPASKVKITPQCTACHKIFSTKGSLIRHQQTTTICQKWLALPIEQQVPMIDKPIHMISDDYLKQATTGDKPFQCRFCSITFTNRGNHHKHYQSALTCNRMAFIEYKRLVSQ